MTVGLRWRLTIGRTPVSFGRSRRNENPSVRFLRMMLAFRWGAKRKDQLHGRGLEECKKKCTWGISSNMDCWIVRRRGLHTAAQSSCRKNSVRLRDFADSVTTNVVCVCTRGIFSARPTTITIREKGGGEP